MNKPPIRPPDTRWIRYNESPPAVDPITQGQYNDNARTIIALPNMAITLSKLWPEALDISNWTEAQVQELYRKTRPYRFPK